MQPSLVTIPPFQKKKKIKHSGRTVHFPKLPLSSGPRALPHPGEPSPATTPQRDFRGFPRLGIQTGEGAEKGRLELGPLGARSDTTPLPSPFAPDFPSGIKSGDSGMLQGLLGPRGVRSQLGAWVRCPESLPVSEPTRMVLLGPGAPKQRTGFYQQPFC